MALDMERVLTVSARRYEPDVWGMPGYDDRHVRNTLIDSGLVKNVESFYFSEYKDPNTSLIKYCEVVKPQAIMLSINNWPPDSTGPPSVDTFSELNKKLAIPIVMFWFDIHVTQFINMLRKYSDITDLHIIFGADQSSHIPLSQDINYVYAGLAFENCYFSLLDVSKDIDVGFLGTLWKERIGYITGLVSRGFNVYTAGGVLTDEKIIVPESKDVSRWITYKEYLELISRMKVSLNFALLEGGKYQVRARVWETLLGKTLLLEEDNPVTCRYFTPYEDYVPFSGIDDLAEKIEYYLRNSIERDIIRVQGWKTVVDLYNPTRLWKSIFDEVDSLPSHNPGILWNKSYFNNLG